MNALRTFIRSALCALTRLPASAVPTGHDYAAGFAAGRSAERERIREILTCPAAASRRAMAQALAFDTDLCVDVAVRLLTQAPAAGRAGALAWKHTAAPVPRRTQLRRGAPHA